MNKNFKSVGLLGMSAFLAMGCNSFSIDSGNGQDGGTSGNCLAAVTGDDGGAQLPLNTNVTTNAGSGISTEVAEVFMIPGESRSVSKVTLKLDQITPANTSLQGPIHVAIYPDATMSTTGHGSPTAPNMFAPYIDPTTGVAASSTSVNAANINAYGNPQWYDFCFDGAGGDGCSGNRGGVTFQTGQVYWIVISGAPAGGKTSFIEWRGTNTSCPYSAGEIQTTSGFLPVNTPSTNHNFDFKLGC